MPFHFRLPSSRVSPSPSSQHPHPTGSPASTSTALPPSPTKSASSTHSVLPPPSHTHSPAQSRPPDPTLARSAASGACKGGSTTKLSLDRLPPYPSPSATPLSLRSSHPASSTTLSLESNARSSSNGSQLSSDFATDDGTSSSGFTSAASSVSSLHASDDDRMSFLGSGDGKMGHSSSAVNDQGLSGDASFQSRGFGQQGGPHVGESPMSLEEDTPRGERPPVLSVPSLAGGGQGHDETSTESANGKSEKSGSPSPSYFPYSPDESISPRSEVPPHVVAPPRAPTQAEASFAPSSHPPTHVLAREPPPSAFRSPSYPPASASSSSGGISAVRPSARSYSHQTNPSVSTTSTGQSQADSWRSSIFSTTSSSSASSFSSSSSCSVSTPVLPRPWLASDQLLHKGDSVDIRDEDALVVETTDESYVVVACLPGFSLDCITLATKSRRTLHIVADRWEREHSAHFERKVTFGTDADLSKIRAQFDGSMLRVTVSRRPAVVVSSSASFTSSVHDKPMFSAHRGSSPLPLAGAAGTSSPWGTGSESWAPARPSSTRSSAPGLLDRVSSSNSTSTVGSDDGDKNSSTTSTLRAKSPDAATKVLQQAARQSNDLDEYLARARARDGDKYTS